MKPPPSPRRGPSHAPLPRIRYPDDLPVAQHRQEIAEAIRAHPVVIVSGETGSGKTTQIPKICLDIGRGSAGLVGCTQPRRIAAVTVAARVAEEMGTRVGGSVGYQIRFDAQCGPDTLIKFMTDGILLAETGRDRLLRAYESGWTAWPWIHPGTNAKPLPSRHSGVSTSMRKGRRATT